MTETLTRTKLIVPPLRPKLVSRPRLIERLNQGLQSGHNITLVSAPAGFGKTTCISEWVNVLDCPVSWLSLDPADDDPGSFFAYFLTALQKVDAKLGQEIEFILHSGQLPPGEIISKTLANDILELEERFLLILDDFHVIQDQSILQVLEELITNLPQPLHLVILTREEPPLPLARLRANNQLTEIRAGDLRFTGNDTGRFLNDVMGLSLSQADVAVLEDKTEGWIAGLQLAGLSIQDRTDPSSFIAALSGSHRFILSYLTEEVLSHQPQEIQHFLLNTSVLNRLNGDVCNAVTGRADGRSMLEKLYHANLFLIPLDDKQEWYRYHHLFADLLRELQHSLQKEKIAELHQRASNWYAQAGGEGDTFASEAIEHALSAKDYPLAVELLESYAIRLIMQGHVKRVNSWVQAIPEQWQSQSPKTNLAFAWMHLLRGDYIQASPYLERLRAPLTGDSNESQLSESEASLKAEWLVLQSLVIYGQSKTMESKTIAESALAIVPEGDSRVRSLAYYVLASDYRILGEYQQAVEIYQKSIHFGRASNNLVAEMMSTVALGEMALEHGELHLAYEITTPVIDRVEGADSLPPTSAGVYGLLGEVYYQWRQLRRAREYIKRAHQLTTLGGYNSITILYLTLLSRLSQAEGDLEAAYLEIKKAFELLQVDTVNSVRQRAVSQQVRVHLARNRPAAAETALKGLGFSFQDQFSFPTLHAEQNLSQATGQLFNSSLCVLLHRNRAGRDSAGLKQGMELADQLVAHAYKSQCIIVALETLLIRAQMHSILRNNVDSRADYVRAVELAEPEGIIGVFCEQGPSVAEALTKLAKDNQFRDAQSKFVTRILSAISTLQFPDAGNRMPPLVEPLSEREIEVLHLMAEGLKYKEIAGRLFISLNTVRFHVKTIYGKLNVRNRTQAIEVARQFQIL